MMRFGLLMLFCHGTISGAEVMYFLSGFAMGPAAAMAVLSGEFIPAACHSMEHPYVVPGIVLFSTMGYLSICLILLLIMHFDATLSEIVKSTRKVICCARHPNTPSDNLPPPLFCRDITCSSMHDGYVVYMTVRQCTHLPL